MTLQIQHGGLISKISGMLSIMYLFFVSTAFAQVNKVEVLSTKGNWELLVNKKPFYIKGAGGDTHLDVLIECGGNTIRTWGVENAQEILDQAEEKGLKVMLGLWVQHERHGFDYNDEDKIAKQLASFRKAVRKYKDHPALLLWGIGNEYELNYHNTKVWKAVNDIAKMVHEEDQNHPTSTVTAGTNATKLKFVQEVLTDIDIYGINTYGDIGNVRDVLAKGNFDRPYMITEWGPNGHWESPKTRWGSSVEQTSSQKAEMYKMRYEKYIWNERPQCIGSFAFLWGQKQEYTSTWYGVFTENDKCTEAIDALHYCWQGKYPENRSPSIDSVKKGTEKIIKNNIFAPNDKIEFSVYTSDLNKDRLKYEWSLFPESSDLKTGGDAEQKPVSILGNLKHKKTPNVILKAPTNEGKYRLYISVTDGEKVAYANIPFYVDPNRGTQKKKIQLIDQDLKSFEEN